MRRTVGEILEIAAIGAVAPKLHYPLRAAIPVLPDQPVDFLLLAETFQPRRNNEQFSAIGNRHSRAIDRFIRNPSAVELVALHNSDNLLQRRNNRHILFS